MRHKRWVSLLPMLLLLSGCGSSAAKDGVTAAASPAPSATPWIAVTLGSAAPSPTGSYPASASPSDAGFLPLPAATPAPTPAPTCAGAAYRYSKINGLSVTPGTTSATATWYNTGGDNLKEFRMTAISQDVVVGRQRDIGWVTVTPAAKCGQVSATISGLDRKTHYVFAVDAVVTRRSGEGTRAGTVFRSGPVLTR